MTRIKCEATWCNANQYGMCINTDIELSYDVYEQFWCKSNVQFGMTEKQRHALTMSELRKVELEWEKLEDLKK